ncbi:MAG TPA: DsbC family protein [Trinickia sp.]|jgi:thiol:disulfide interchange protein DsbC|uniref:DsbC family protein n=1 Tax=Trinickia sp. TaxID=2571163 RepID=UPI002C418FEE|nr:DsbC family protein [Trinickia sp.]HTI17582.1 DsbC family protein [Trinickia sp.]
MPTILRHVAFSALAAALMIGCSSQAGADQTTDKLKATLQERLPNAHIKGIAKAPIPGLYEVNLGVQIIYSDASGNYVLVGDLVDTKAGTSLTQARLAELNKVDFATLPLGDAIKVVKGNGSRKMAVFSDPNCPYCKQLEATLKSIDNVTVYTFLYPVLSDDSTAKAKSIWCSADRAKTWETWMVDHRPPTTAPICDTSVLDKNLALGHAMNVTGTPTIILADGRRFPGAVSRDELDKALSDALKASPAH